MGSALEPGGNYQGPCRTLFFISISPFPFLSEHQFILDISSVNRVTKTFPLNLVSHISLTSFLFCQFVRVC